MLQLGRSVFALSENGSGNECEEGCYNNSICLFIFLEMSLFLLASELENTIELIFPSPVVGVRNTPQNVGGSNLPKTIISISMYVSRNVKSLNALKRTDDGENALFQSADNEQIAASPALYRIK